MNQETAFSLKDLVEAHRLYREMMPYPELMPEMRRFFLSTLEEAGIAGRERLREEVRQAFGAGEEPPSPEELQDFTDSLIDLYFAHHFSRETIRSTILLARKKDAFQQLQQVLNTEGAASSHIMAALESFCRLPEGGVPLSADEAEGVRVALLNHFVSSQLSFVGIAKRHITMRDVNDILSHSYWSPRRSGMIGGKAAGMFLAHRILMPRHEPMDSELEAHLAMPESYYFSSGILSDFIDYNHLYSFHSQKYKDREVIEDDYDKMGELLERASFPPDVVEDFSSFLNEVGEHPLILRSSSLLEDNFGFMFSGKYESVFLANQGPPRQRLNDFMWGMKQVLKSTFSPAAILYRRDHSLLDFDERMSVLVQKVVGRRRGPYFFPFAAGVAFSRNLYPWSPIIQENEGVVRLVLGLGTRAVDRSGPGYPLMVPLSHPMLRPEIAADRIKKYSQKKVDVLNLEAQRFESVSFHDLFNSLDDTELFHAFSVDQEGHLAPPLFKGQKIQASESCITFHHFISRTPFAPLMRKILLKLEAAYGYPVDVEFAWNDEKLYILQCRPLALWSDRGQVVFPEHISEDKILFTNNRELTNSAIRDIEYIVYVDPRGYAKLPSREERMAVARAVSRLNRLLEGKRYALFGPARWGTNDIQLGVPVGYADINHCLILGEIAFEEDGLVPEVSYGTHFFSDLVEARIVPLAIYPDQPDMIFDDGFLLRSANRLSELTPELVVCADVVRVIHVPSSTNGLFLQVLQDSGTRKGVGFFAPQDKDGRQGGNV